MGSPTLVKFTQNSPGAVKNIRAQIQAESKGLDSASVFNLTGRAIGTLQDEIYTLLQRVNAIANAVNNNASLIVTGGTVSSIEIAAPNGTTTTIPASVTPAVDSLLVVFVTQDSTGGGLIAWNALYRWAVTNIDTTASTVSLFSFVGRTDPADGVVRWFMTGLPLTGQV